MRTQTACRKAFLPGGNKWIRRVFAIMSLVTLLLISACRKQASPSVQATPAPSGPQDPDLRVNASGYHGRSFTGPVYSPRSSPIEDGTTAFNVTYQEGVLVISKGDTMQHLLAIHPDGTYVFDATWDQVRKLTPGRIFLLSGLALRTVVEVEKTADGVSVKTEAAKITDAIKNGRLEGTYKIDFGRLQAGKSSSLRALLPSTLPSLETVYAATTETRTGPGTAEYDVDFSGYNYHVRFTPGHDRIDVKATIKYGGSQGVLAYEGVGYLNNFVSTIRMQIKDGELVRMDFINTNLEGQVDLKWYAVAANTMSAGAAARITSWPAELLKSSRLSKAAYHVPIVVGAVPFDLKVSLGFSFIPAFTSKNSVVEGSKLITYKGSAGFSLANGHARPSGSINALGTVNGDDSRVVASGPIGFTAAAEAPRLELAMGWPPVTTTVAGYLNFVESYGIVTNGMLNSTPCQTNIMAFSVNAGAAYSSPNTFADWLGMPVGTSPTVSLWSKTSKAPGARAPMCPG